MQMSCLPDGEREGSNVPVHMNFLVASGALAGYGWACLVVGERERQVAAGGVLKSTSQFAFSPNICLCNHQPLCPGLVDKKIKSSTLPIVVTISLTNASLCNLRRSPLLRIEPVPCAAVDRERRSMFPPYTSLPAPQDSLITEYHPDIPVRLEPMRRHTVLALERVSESRHISQSIRPVEASLRRPDAPFV